jgi:hypothetical protein
MEREDELYISLATLSPGTPFALALPLFHPCAHRGAANIRIMLFPARKWFVSASDFRDLPTGG